MNFNNAVFLTTATKKENYPKTTLPEIALVGRSNVGKSSLINCIVNRKALARTSSTPGKTATINYYNIDNKLNLVDLPGYGYAKVSKGERASWSKMIDTYLSSRENLTQVIQLVDSRHPPSKDDIIMLDWTMKFGFHPIIIATKTDKLSKTKVTENIKIISDCLNLADNAIIIPFSAQTREGKESVQALLNDITINSVDNDKEVIDND